MKNETMAFLKSGKYRIQVLRSINEKGLIVPRDLSQTLNIHLSQASRTLLELENKGLVECTTPDRVKGRIYRLTEKGARTLKDLSGEK